SPARSRRTSRGSAAAPPGRLQLLGTVLHRGPFLAGESLVRLVFAVVLLAGFCVPLIAGSSPASLMGTTLMHSRELMAGKSWVGAAARADRKTGGPGPCRGQANTGVRWLGVDRVGNRGE